MKKLYSITAGLAFGLLTFSSASIAAEESFVTIGTGGQTGVYYAVGQSICKLVNRGADEHNIKCTAPSTGGSIANINAITAGDMDMGVAQSDWQYHVYNGTSKFEGAADKEIRAVFSVHAEPFTVVARNDSGIKTFDDLVGKRVNLGNPGSGSRATMDSLLLAKGWTPNDFKLAAELKSAEMSSALCDNNLDAITFVVGHPSGSIKEATTSCDASLISVTGPAIDQLLDENEYYSKATIPGGIYKGTDGDIETYGVYATFISSTRTSEEKIYQITKSVFDNFDRFKKLHPAFGHLQESEMIKNALSAPLHDGAVKYYKERGWME